MLLKYDEYDEGLEQYLSCDHAIVQSCNRIMKMAKFAII
jgi:hypothetical protein